MTTTVVASADIKVHASVFLKGLTATIEKRLDKIAQLGVETVQRTLAQSNSRGISPSPPGSPPHRGNSVLIGSIHWKQEQPLERLIGTGATHGRIQEMGGTNTGTNMPIPISEKAKRHRTRGGKARDFPVKLIPIRASTGRLLLIQKMRSGKHHGRNWTIHYLLTNKVTIPERPYLRPLLQNSYFLARVKNIMAKG